MSGLILAVLVVHAVNIGHYPTANDDEGTYLAQAYAVRQGWGLAHYTYWYDHPPLAWIQLAAISWLPELVLPDVMTLGAGRLSMLPVTAVSLILVYILVRRLGFARWVGWLALAIYGLSPLSVTLMRQIYLDGFAVMWILAAFVLALTPRRHLWHYLAAGGAAAVAVLSKETILVVLPALVFALWHNTHRSTRVFSLAGFGSALVLVGSFYPLYALLKGELLPGSKHVSLVGALRFQLSSRQGSGNLFTDGSNANALVASWLHADAVMVLGGVVATIACLFVRRLRGPALAAAMLIAVALRPGGYLPAMYVVQLLPFFAILVAGGIAVALRSLTTPGPIKVLSVRTLEVRPASKPRRTRSVVALCLFGRFTISPGWVRGPGVTSRVLADRPLTGRDAGRILRRIGIRLVPASLRPSAWRLARRGVDRTVGLLDRVAARLADGGTGPLAHRWRTSPMRARLSPASRWLATWIRDRWRRPARPWRFAVATALVLAGVVAVIPGWVNGNRYALTASHHQSYVAAADWMLTEVDDRADSRVVVDDTLWLDLVRHGFEPDRVIWFYKLDVDPAVSATLADGWRDVDYVMATPVMRGDRDARPTLDDLFRNSTVVASFGDGDGRIEIRRVNKEAS